MIPLAGRNRFVFWENGLLRCSVALALHVFFLVAGHRRLFGVAPIG